MSGVRPVIDRIVNWLAANARSFSYLLPDSLELGLYRVLAAYFAAQLAQQQV
jgi:hypothetical protein